MPEAAGPEAGEPETVEPEAARPGRVELRPRCPRCAESVAVVLEASAPVAAEPEVAERMAAEPVAVGSESSQPKAAATVAKLECACTATCTRSGGIPNPDVRDWVAQGLNDQGIPIPRCQGLGCPGVRSSPWSWMLRSLRQRGLGAWGGSA